MSMLYKCTFTNLLTVAEVVAVFADCLLKIFEKALDEPKYSSLYAQLCHRLFRDAPNFEPPESNIRVRLQLITVLFITVIH